MVVNKTVTIAAHGYRCVVAPALGGSLLRLDYCDVPLLRPSDDATDPTQAANFPLLPFANRIGNGCFTFGDRDVALAPEPSTAPHAHHGQAWRTSWEVESCADDQILLAYRHHAGDWPWSYRATQHVALDAEGLRITLTLENLSGSAMPAGAGIHPYFVRHTTSRIIAWARTIWRNDETGLAVAPEADSRFAGRALSLSDLDGIDNFFAGPAEVLIEGGPMSVRLAGDPSVGFHLYAPVSQNYFCVEPVSHTPNSFGRGEFAPGDVIVPSAIHCWIFRIGAMSEAFDYNVAMRSTI